MNLLPELLPKKEGRKSPEGCQRSRNGQLSELSHPRDYLISSPFFPLCQVIWMLPELNRMVLAYLIRFLQVMVSLTSSEYVSLACQIDISGGITWDMTV